ncbi:hypothetical protein N9567_09595 [Planktomarina temperata]|nr:hypothetical protein [Planktomarina temperata]MDC0929874.1 hypothetical protein [Planktomarina temperata]
MPDVEAKWETKTRGLLKRFENAMGGDSLRLKHCSRAYIPAVYIHSKKCCLANSLSAGIRVSGWVGSVSLLIGPTNTKHII